MASLLTIILALLVAVVVTDAASLVYLNNCPYKVWPCTIPVGVGLQLNPGSSATIYPPAGTKSGRIWARTGCHFNDIGQGSCTTGDTGGGETCDVTGKPPVTLIEYTLGLGSDSDFYYISLVDGFNVPMSFAPVSGSCHAVSCAADINAHCPPELKVNGGCQSACLKFGSPKYCCRGDASSCRPTNYSRFFKGLCPEAYSYAYDDKSSNITCAAGTDYKVTFCP